MALVAPLLPHGGRWRRDGQGLVEEVDVDVQARREAAYARAGVRSLSHRPYQLAAFAEDMKLAVSIGAVTETEAEAALRRVQTLSEDEISEWRSIINAEAFGGETLSWIKGQIRDAGGDL